MTTTNIGRPSHMGEDGVRAMVAQRYGVGPELTDAAAVTIASWWQAPGGPELAFAELASSGHLDSERIGAAIAANYASAEPEDQQALDMLGTWAVNRSLGRTGATGQHTN